MTGLFPLRRPDVCFRVEIGQVKHIENRALVGLISHCYFFATPTRLAAGLGTKDYPRVYCETLRPGLALKAKLWFPRAGPGEDRLR
jgi:hypothetical protein